MDRFVSGTLDGLLTFAIAALIALNAGLIPIDGSAKTAEAGFWPCFTCAPFPGGCPASIGACVGTAGPIGGCAGWGLACIDSWPRCRGTLAWPAPALPCGTMTGC